MSIPISPTILVIPINIPWIIDRNWYFYTYFIKIIIFTFYYIKNIKVLFKRKAFLISLINVSRNQARPSKPESNKIPVFLGYVVKVYKKSKSNY